MPNAFHVRALLCVSLVVMTATGMRVQAQTPAVPRGVEIVPITPHGDAVWSMVFSPDGRRLLTGGDDGDAKLWDVASGRLIRTFETDMNQILSVAFSTDGTRVLAAGGGTTETDLVMVWDAASGETVATLKGHKGMVSYVGTSTDGKRWLSYSADSIKTWDAETGGLLTSSTPPKECGRLLTARFVTEPQILSQSSAWDGFAGFCDLASGQWKSNFKLKSPASAVISSDGKRVLIGNDGSIGLYNVATGDLIRAFEQDRRAAHSVALSPDGSRVASGDFNNTIRLWDATSGKLVRTQMHTGDRQVENVIEVAFSPDGRLLASTSGDLTTKLWDVASGRLVRTIGGSTKPMLSVAFSPDGTTVLAGGGDNKLHLWDLSAGRQLRTFDHSGAVNAVTYSRDGARALAGDGDKIIKLWDLATGRLARSIRVNPQTKAYHGRETEEVNVVAISPDGSKLLSGADVPKLWDAATGRLIHDYRTAEIGGWGVGGLAFSPDGKRFIYGINEQFAIADTASGKHIKVIQADDMILSAAFSPDGKMMLSGGRQDTQLRDAETGDVLRSFAGINAAFSQDGGFVVTLDGYEVKLWRTATGELVKHFEVDAYNIKALALSPDGTRVATAHGDSGVRIWNLDSGTLLVSLFGAQDGEWLVITPEGYFAASEKGADLVSIVRGLDVYSVDQLYQQLYRPDLIRQKLSGDPDGVVKRAALKLNLEAVLRSGAAPSVAVVSPADGSTQTGNRLSLDVQLQDQGGGVGRIEWRVNGITMGIQDPAPGSTALGSKVSRTLPVGDGANLIEVVAYNAKNQIASQPVSIVVNAQSGAQKSPPGLFVLAVGINDYRDPQLKLKFAVDDVRAMVDALNKGGRELYRTVEVRTILDSDVTAEKLAEAFDALAVRMQPNDVFVLYMSGHGVTEDGRYYFIPQAFVDDRPDAITASGIGQDKLQDWLSRIPALRAALIYDTCESGSAGDDATSFHGGQKNVAAARLTQAMGRSVLSAALDNAPALEGYNGHGVFTATILAGLADADTNHNQRIEMSELARYLEDKMPAITKTLGIRQLPQIKVVGGDFSLVRRLDARR